MDGEGHPIERDFAGEIQTLLDKPEMAPAGASFGTSKTGDGGGRVEGNSGERMVGEVKDEKQDREGGMKMVHREGAGNRRE